MDNLSRKEERATFQLKMESLRATTSFLDTPPEENNSLVFTFLDSMAKRRNRGTQQEHSSKPLKHSIVKRILVFKR